MGRVHICRILSRYVDWIIVASLVAFAVFVISRQTSNSDYLARFVMALSVFLISISLSFQVMIIKYSINRIGQLEGLRKLSSDLRTLAVVVFVSLVRWPTKYVVYVIILVALLTIASGFVEAKVTKLIDSQSSAPVGCSPN